MRLPKLIELPGQLGLPRLKQPKLGLPGLRGRRGLLGLLCGVVA